MLCLISIATSMGDTIFGRPHPTKFSGMGTTGPPYSLMSAERSEPASNVKGSQERNISNLCH
jgi:hypothetical protein